MMNQAQFIDQLTHLLKQSANGTGLASPRPFIVVWTDEDFGKRSLVVIARTQYDARSIAEDATGRYDLDVRSL